MISKVKIFYIQKKKQHPDNLTQQISVDSDCANDGCCALFEHRQVRVCKSSHLQMHGKNPEMPRVNKSGCCSLFRHKIN